MMKKQLLVAGGGGFVAGNSLLPKMLKTPSEGRELGVPDEEIRTPVPGLNEAI